MNQQQIISTLIDISVDAFLKQLKPDEYARIAAHKAAYLAAAEYCNEFADLAALTAASSYLVHSTEAINYTARLTDKAYKTFASELEYKAEAGSYLSSLPIVSTNSPISFISLSKTLDEAIFLFNNHISSSFQMTLSNDERLKNKAKQAAHYVYGDTYATVRSAYVRAFFSANKVSDIERRQKIFQQTMNSRLQKDLSYDLITPSFFMLTVANITTRIIALLIFFTGITIILAGFIPINILPFVPIEVTGSISLTLSLGLFGGHFFAQQQVKKIENSNQNRIELNTFI